MASVGSMFRSAVFKLTTVYVAIVMAISLSFSFALYKFAVSELETGLTNEYVRWLSEYQPYGLRQPNDPAAELAARSHHIFAELMYFNILVFVCTAFLSYYLAKRTLHPIERAHEQQQRFTADVSHELRTPLTALKMDTEVALLDKKASSKELRETLKGNLEEAERMETLVNNLLQLASLEANQLKTDFHRLNIKDVAAGAVNVVSKFAAGKKIKLDTTLTDGYVIGNDASLTQLIVILIENAIKYSPEKSEVRVASSSTAQTVTVVVEDSGQGIPQEALPHVFDRFYRADQARSSGASHGFGLGLSLAKLIADLHSGEIILSSTSGRGTRAIVRLPASRK